jgi:hypothetical protein
MSKENAGVVVLSTHTEAENAVKELQRAGFDMKMPETAWGSGDDCGGQCSQV